LARTSVAEMIVGMRAVFRPVLQSDAVALVFDDVDPALQICTDEGKLLQVLRNFVANAIKFTERGEIRVTVRAEADDRVTFAVADTGIGISPEEQALIFQEFTQLDNPRQRHTQGTGLGLSLSRRIAQLLHGSIGVRSSAGGGSTFWITLPRDHPLANPDSEITTIDNVSVPEPPRE